jgi:predicted 3-demethylubiquinone-9 3-methyltransferase (glyoxalase superfamily)
MQKIIPHLWFDKEAVDAARWYVSLFPDSDIINITSLQDTPSGDCKLVDFKLANFSINTISAGPIFTLNPSISLMVSCRDIEEVSSIIMPHKKQ